MSSTAIGNPGRDGHLMDGQGAYGEGATKPLVLGGASMVPSAPGDDEQAVGSGEVVHGYGATKPLLLGGSSVVTDAPGDDELARVSGKVVHGEGAIKPLSLGRAPRVPEVSKGDSEVFVSDEDTQGEGAIDPLFLNGATESAKEPPREVTGTKSGELEGSWSTEVLSGAVAVRLGMVAVSDGAVALVEAILIKCLVVDAVGRKTQRRAKGVAHLRRAVAAITGSMLTGWLHDSSAAVFQSHSHNAFTDELVGHAHYEAAENAMLTLGLLEKSRSVSYPHRFGFGSFERKAARIRPSKSLLDIASQYGLGLDNIVAAFKIEYPITAAKVSSEALVEVRTLLSRAQKKAGIQAERMADVEARPVFEPIRADVAAMNAEAASHRYEGCRPPSWSRIFMDNSLLYGRWHAARGGYQVLKKAERAAIRIDGQPTVEMDIRASHLTILAALAGVELPEGDPYEVPGIPREVVKQWVVATLGNGKSPREWPQKTRSERPKIAEWSINMVREPALARLPFLSDPTSPAIVSAAGLSRVKDPEDVPKLLSLRLMAIEATAMTLALRRLREAGTIALSIHDSIIVVADAAEHARRVLGEACQRTYGVVPQITWGPKVDQ